MFDHNDFDIISSLRDRSAIDREIPTRSAISRQRYLENKIARLRAEDEERRYIEAERQTKAAVTLFARIADAVRRQLDLPGFYKRASDH
ncbi:MAG: hypothetical protein AB3N20_22305 [Rhizobiaceae bacterium]